MLCVTHGSWLIVRSLSFLQNARHVKTHKTKEGCLIQAGVGTDDEASTSVIGFVASTVPELSMLTELACEHQCKPFSDVIFGIPVCVSKLPAIHQLKTKMALGTNGHGVIHVLVDNTRQVDFLEEYIRTHSLGDKWSVFLKVCAMNRSDLDV